MVKLQSLSTSTLAAPEATTQKVGVVQVSQLSNTTLDNPVAVVPPVDINSQSRIVTSELLSTLTPSVAPVKDISVIMIGQVQLEMITCSISSVPAIIPLPSIVIVPEP